MRKLSSGCLRSLSYFTAELGLYSKCLDSKQQCSTLYTCIANMWYKFSYAATHTPWQATLINQAPPNLTFFSGMSSITPRNQRQNESMRWTVYTLLAQFHARLFLSVHFCGGGRVVSSHSANDKVPWAGSWWLGSPWSPQGRPEDRTGSWVSTCPSVSLPPSHPEILIWKSWWPLAHGCWSRWWSLLICTKVWPNMFSNFLEAVLA